MLNKIIPIKYRKVCRIGYLDIKILVNDYEWKRKGFSFGNLILILRSD